MENIDFLMKISDVYNIIGRGKIVLGTVLYGSITPGSVVKIVKVNPKVGIRIFEFEMTIKNIEGFRRPNLPLVSEGENCGIDVHGVESMKIVKGMYLVRGKGDSKLNEILQKNG